MSKTNKDCLPSIKLKKNRDDNNNRVWPSKKELFQWLKDFWNLYVRIKKNIGLMKFYWL